MAALGNHSIDSSFILKGKINKKNLSAAAAAAFDDNTDDDAKHNNFLHIIPSNITTRLGKLFLSEKPHKNRAAYKTSAFIPVIPGTVVADVMVYEQMPFSFVSNNFFRSNLVNEYIRWVQGCKVFFPGYNKNRPLDACCFIGAMGDDSATLNKGCKIRFPSVEKDRDVEYVVYGMAAVPCVVGGVLMKVSTILVEDTLPNNASAKRSPDMIISLSSFGDSGVGIGGNLPAGLIPAGTIETRIKNSTISINADGFYSPQTQKAGVGVFVAKDSIYNISRGVFKPVPLPCAEYSFAVSAQRAEVSAGIDAMKQVFAISHYAGFQFRKAHITTRSRYLFDGITRHVRVWCTSDWTTSKGKLVAHRDLWEELLDTTVNEFFSAHVEVDWLLDTTKGEADELARLGAGRSEKDIGNGGENMVRIDRYYDGEKDMGRIFKPQAGVERGDYVCAGVGACCVPLPGGFEFVTRCNCCGTFSQRKSRNEQMRKLLENI